MGIFDIFDGSSTKEAAEKNAALYEQYKRAATGRLEGAQTAGLGALDVGMTGGQGALDTAKGYLSSGTGASLGEFDNAIGAYQPLSDLGAKYGGATNLYLGALGAGGAAGTADATAAFQASPGYEFMRDEAVDQAQRKIARFQPGGNEADAIARLSSGLANKEYAAWLDRLGGFVSPELTATGQAATGRSAGYTGRAAVQGRGGEQLAGVEGTRAGLYSDDAAKRLGLYRGTAQDLSNVYGQATSGTAASNNAAAQAEMAASGQFWNGLMNLGGSFAGAAFPVKRPA